MSVAAIQRAIETKLAAWSVTTGIPVGYRTIRDPLGLEAEHNEKVIVRFLANRTPQSRRGQSHERLVFELHCMSIRGDLRDDGLADRARVLASLVSAEFVQDDLQVFDTVTGDGTTSLGTLHFLSASWRQGDSRGTIFLDSVDYTLETPKTEHIVLQVVASLNS